MLSPPPQPLPPVPCHSKNRAGNYRLTLNGKSDYDVRSSNCTWSASAAKRSRFRQDRSSDSLASNVQRCRAFKSRNLNHVHLNQVLRGNEKNGSNEKKKNNNNCNNVKGNNAVAPPPSLSTVLDRMVAHADRQQQEEQLQDEEDQERHQDHHRSGHHIHHGYQYEYDHEKKTSRSKRYNREPSKGCSDAVKPRFCLGITPKIPIDSLVQKVSEETSSLCYYWNNTKISGQPKNHLHMAPASQPTLQPIGQARAATRGIRERTKPLRLNGADLYVARMGHMKSAENSHGATKTQPKPDERESLDQGCQCDASLIREASEAGFATSQSTFSSSCDSLSVASTTPSISSSSLSPAASLHDELRFPNGVPKTSSVTPRPTRFNSTANKSNDFVSRSHVHASRPCYRCITYMHNVGIKRVFWTNSDGHWEGGKVRDLVDILDGGGAPGQENEDAMGMFVTKHEVLMLRRVMGAKQIAENDSRKGKKGKRP